MPGNFLKFRLPEARFFCLESVMVNLNHRQTQVIKRLAEGLTVKQIAGELGISDKTVEYHRAKAQRQIGTNSIAILTRFALIHGLTQL